ncbi:hypothetical protein ACFL35_14900 [Candidatus Riflebacteria bacterium]
MGGRVILLICFVFLIFSPCGLMADYELDELKVNDWFFWQKNWQQSHRYPEKSFCLYKVEVRPGETYAISLKYRSQENIKFTMGYSDLPPFESLLSTNHRSNVIQTDNIQRTKRYIHNRIIKISEKSRGRNLFIYIALDRGEEEAFKFGIRVSYLTFAGLTSQNRHTFVNDGNVCLEDHQALKEEELVRQIGSNPLQDIFKRIPIIRTQSGYFFPKSISQILIPRHGILTRNGTRRELPEYSKKDTFENRRVHLLDKGYAVSFRLFFPGETHMSVWIKTFSDGNYFWGSRELNYYLNNVQKGSLSEVETREPKWSWQKVGRFSFKNGLNILKFRKKASTGSIAVLDRVLLTRDPAFSPEEYDRVNKISVVTAPDEIKPELLEKRVRNTLNGKWTYSMKNKKSRWNGHVMIQQKGSRIKIFGYAKRFSDNKSLSWVEDGKLDGRLLRSAFSNRYVNGEATYNLSKDGKSIYGLWNRVGKKESDGLIQMVRASDTEKKAETH